ncbi:MAG: DNA-3-methyladenine glycosylase [Actinomycetota bacterium]
MIPAGRRLSRSFFARPSTEVAPDLLGRVLVRTLPTGARLAVRLVETEAYQEDDAASHSFRGRTARTEVMFGPPGCLYVYFTYGMHFCMNVVTGANGEGSAVLLRAAEPLGGLTEMRALRGVEDERALCSGPGKLCQALGVDRAENGDDLVRGSALALHAGSPVAPDRVEVTPRIGIRHAAELPWRFVVRGDRFVSRPARVRG